MNLFYRQRYWMIIVIVFIMSACSIPPEMEADVSSTPNTLILFPTRTSSPTETTSKVVEVTNTLTPTKLQVETSAPESVLSAIQVEPGNLLTHKTNSCVFYKIGVVSWFESNTQVQYSYEHGDLCIGENKSGWATYDISSQSSITTTQPTNFSIPIDTSDGQGFRSPSGDYLLFAKQTENEDGYGTSSLWLVSGQNLYKLEDFVYPVYITASVWYDNENKIIFSVSFEGGSNLFVVDTQSKTTNSINEISDFDRSAEMWSLSPNGKMLAIVEYGSSLLWTVLLENGNTINTGLEATFPTWSVNSTMVYFWAGSINDYDFSQGSDLYKYDTLSGNNLILVDISSLEKTLGFIPFSSFAVSPDQNKLALLNGGELWVVLLNNN